MNEKKVVICLPAYKAERTLAKTVAEIPQGVASQLILVDDASPDNTVRVAKKLGLKTIVHQANKGYGGNQKTCYQKALSAGADIIVLLHPDYQYDPKTIPDLIKPLKQGGADFVFGSRFLGKGNPLKGGMPIYRYLGNKLTTFFENLFLGTNFSELHSGLKAYSREFLETIPYQKYSDKFVFDSQMLIDAVLVKSKIIEVPIPTRYAEDSSSVDIYNSFKYIFETFFELFKRKYLKRTIKLLDKIAQARAERNVALFLDKIKPKEKVIDIGAGSCLIAQLVQQKGNCSVTPCDIVDYNQTKMSLKVYDGKKLPFADNSFDTAILTSVLHHCLDPVRVLKEAKRVSQKIIIVEDVYLNLWDKFWLFLNDWLSNVPFGQNVGISFKTDGEWKKIFKNLNLSLMEEGQGRTTFKIVKLKVYFVKVNK